MEQTEQKLLPWIQNLQQRGIPLGNSRIQKKARAIFIQIKDNLEDKTEDEIKETFQASKGWLARFKKRNGIKIIKAI